MKLSDVLLRNSAYFLFFNFKDICENLKKKKMLLIDIKNLRKYTN